MTHTHLQEKDKDRHPFKEIADKNYDDHVEQKGTVFVYQLIDDQSKGEYSM